MLQVGMVAVNDGILLLNHIHKILKKYFRGKLYYVDLVDLSKEENYGKPDPSNAANVKYLYKELDLQGVFMEYESKTYEKLNGVIEAHQSKPIQEVLKSLLAEISKRHK